MKYLIILAALAAVGCDRIPGSTANLERRSRTVLTDALLDADSAKFQKLKAVEYSDKGKTEHLICGEVNAKNRMGAFSGFTRFIVGRDDGVWLIDPKETSGETDFNEAVDLCSRLKSSDFGGGSDSFACKRVDELIERQSRQAGFDDVWKSACQAG